MWTSTASKPARSKAAAISTCPLTPCSRRIATRGHAFATRRASVAAASRAKDSRAEVRAEIDVEPRAAREGHLEQRHEEAAVAAIVVGEEQARGVQLLHGGEEPPQARRIVEIGRRRAELAVDLREARGAQAVL